MNSLIGGSMDKRRKGKSVVGQSFAMISQFGISMLVPIFLCSFAGWWLDEKFGTGFLFIVFFFMGALAGFRNIYIIVRKITESSSDAKNDYEAVRKSIENEKKKKN